MVKLLLLPFVVLLRLVEVLGTFCTWCIVEVVHHLRPRR